MSDKKDNFFDDLKRAYEMEERMAGVLIDLCEPAMGEDSISDPDVMKIRRMLMEVQKDTLRHKEMVRNMLAERARDNVDG
jgi:hypothetical protein